jgi:Prealbumin-like fold domain
MRSLLRLNVSLALTLFIPACILIAFTTVPIRFIEKYALFVPSYAERPPATDITTHTADDKKSADNTDMIHGTLIVTKDVINRNSAKSNAKPSDFTITVHGNSPSPSSFQGSSSGTAVKLQMGMYSVTEQGPSGYNSSRSGDCSGGMMSVETKTCKITNTYTNKP